MLKENNQAKLDKAEERFHELEKLLADESVISDQSQYGKLAKEFSELTSLMEKYHAFLKTTSQIKELQDIVKDKSQSDMKELAELEIQDLKPKVEALATELTDYFDPSKNEPDKDIIIEIRAGTGGLEASLFAGDLYRMYSKYADLKGWSLEVMSYVTTEAGGVKEVSFSLSGKECSKRLKWESGIHRVQRVSSALTNELEQARQYLGKNSETKSFSKSITNYPFVLMMNDLIFALLTFYFL